MTESFKAEWDNFCDGLKEAGNIITNEDDLDERTQAEGHRYLIRLLRLALEMNLEHSNIQEPSFYSLSHETAKIGADNPDNVYLNANISGAKKYRLFGNINEVNYLSFGVKENKYSIDGTMVSHGEIDSKDLLIDQHGNFQITLGSAATSTNHLHLPESANMLIVRQTYLDRLQQKHADIHIKLVNENPKPKALTYLDLKNQLAQSLLFVTGTAKTFINWTREFQSNHFNALPLGDQAFFQAAGGDPNIYYLHGYYNFKSTECMEIRTSIPDCDYWNFQLENFWMESLDYRHYPIHINGSNAVIEDNELIIRVTHHSINALNNLITEGRQEGAMLLRWVGASDCPIPKVAIKSITDIEARNAQPK